MKRKVLSIVLTLAMLVTMIPAMSIPVSADSDAEVDVVAEINNSDYSIDNKGKTITSTVEGASYKIEYVETVNGKNSQAEITVTLDGANISAAKSVGLLLPQSRYFDRTKVVGKVKSNSNVELKNVTVIVKSNSSITAKNYAIKGYEYTIKGEDSSNKPQLSIAIKNPDSEGAAAIGSDSWGGLTIENLILKANDSTTTSTVKKACGISSTELTINNCEITAYGPSVSANGASTYGISSSGIEAAYSKINSYGGNVSDSDSEPASFNSYGIYSSGETAFVGCEVNAVGGEDNSGKEVTTTLNSYGIHCGSSYVDEDDNIQIVGSKVDSKSGIGADEGSYGIYASNNMLLSCKSTLETSSLKCDSNITLKSRSEVTTDSFLLNGKNYYSSYSWNPYDFVSTLSVTDNSELTSKTADVKGNVVLSGGKITVSDAGLTLSAVDNKNTNTKETNPKVGGKLSMKGGILSVNGGVTAAAIDIDENHIAAGTTEKDYSNGIKQTTTGTPIVITFGPMFYAEDGSASFDSTAPTNEDYIFAGWSLESSSLADKQNTYEDGKCYYAVWKNAQDTVVNYGKVDFKDLTTQYKYSKYYNDNEEGRNGLAFDTASKLVTMNGAIIDSHEKFGIRTPNKTKINLVKDTFIIVHGDEARFDEDDDEENNKAWFYGINSNQEVDITGNATLNITVDAGTVPERYKDIEGLTINAVGIQVGHDTTVAAKVNMDVTSANNAYGFYIGNGGHGYTFDEGFDADINLVAKNEAIGIQAGKPLDIKNAKINITVNDSCEDSVGLYAKNNNSNNEKQWFSIDTSDITIAAKTAVEGNSAFRVNGCYVYGQAEDVYYDSNYLYPVSEEKDSTNNAIKKLTRDADEKQVVFTTKESTVKFESNGGSEVASQTVKGYLDTSDNKIVPTKAGCTFVGWYTDNNQLKNFSPKNDLVTEDMTLYAKWVDTNSLISVAGTVKDVNSAVINKAKVEIRLGNEVIGNAVTDESGAFTISNIPSGDYQLVVRDNNGEKTYTQFLSVGESISNLDIKLSDNKWSLLRVRSNSPDVAVDNLAAAANNYSLGDNENSVLISLSVRSKADDDSNEVQNAIRKMAGKQTLELMDMSLTKTIKTNNAETTSDYSADNNTVMTVVVPYDTTLYNICLYRYYGNKAEALKKLNEKPANGQEVDGTFYVGENKIYVYASKFSTYAIGYGAKSSCILGKIINGLIMLKGIKWLGIFTSKVFNYLTEYFLPYYF